MGAGLEGLKTCDGLAERRKRWDEDSTVGCGQSISDGMTKVVSSANRGGSRISDEVLLNHELLQFARQGDAEKLSLAIEKGAWTETRRPLVMKPQKPDRQEPLEPDATELGMTAIMFAAQAGSAECVRRLIWADADVNAIEEDGWSALHFAAKECNLEVCQILLQGSANTKLKNSEDQTAEQVAKEEDSDFARRLASLVKQFGKEQPTPRQN